MMRGNAGHDIFFSSADRSRFLLLVQQGIERYGHRVHAFCLMSNHVHLLIQVGSMPLAKIMQNLGFRYTRHVNQHRGVTGHLFQGRYKAILVDADSYLLELARYIHLNPVRAGVCRSVDDFEWSSQHAYMGSTTIPWLYTQEVLARFSTDSVRARQLFRDFILQGAGEQKRMEFHHGTHLGQILGDDHFAERSLAASGYPGMIKPPALESIIEAVCEEYDLDESVFRQQGKSRKHSEAQAMAALIIQNLEGITLTELSRAIDRELSALSQAAGRLRKRMADNKPLQEKARKIADVIKTPKCQA